MIIIITLDYLIRIIYFSEQHTVIVIIVIMIIVMIKLGVWIIIIIVIKIITVKNNINHINSQNLIGL